jgi:hypothetical protein
MKKLISVYKTGKKEKSLMNHVKILAETDEYTHYQR